MLWLFPPLLGRQFHEGRAHLALASLWVPLLVVPGAPQALMWMDRRWMEVHGGTL